MKMKAILVILVCTLLACSGNDNENNEIPRPQENSDDTLDYSGFYFGADLSYVNEMLDCGAKYYDAEGAEKDPYQIFQESGCNLVRLRLWNDPCCGMEYSDFADVKLAIQRAKGQNMQVMLDFHYSDNWADPGRQTIPAAWRDLVDNTPVLKDSLYNFTYNTLKKLGDQNLLPEIVQVGNEINAMIMQDNDEVEWPIDWERNSELLNSGIKAVRDISAEYNKKVEVMLHIAQPENGDWWFSQARNAGVTDFDWIGLSYYPLWSDYDLGRVDEPLESLIQKFDKKLMIVETAYPYTLRNQDDANNILGSPAAIDGIDISPEGQLEFLNQLQEKIKLAGGEGLIYWEPAWVSTSCNTQWGQGSHWDNAVLFDENNKAMIGMDWYKGSLE